MFFTDGKLRGLEKFMQLPKYPTKKGGGKYRSLYNYTKGDCNCVNCLHWKKKYGCSQKVCPYIQERIYLNKNELESAIIELYGGEELTEDEIQATLAKVAQAHPSSRALTEQEIEKRKPKKKKKDDNTKGGNQINRNFPLPKMNNVK